MKTEFMAGFSRVNVTPMLGIGLEGYYVPRRAREVLDELELNALAFSDGEQRAVWISADQCMLKKDVVKAFRQSIAERTGLPEERIYLHATHTHTAPCLEAESEDALVQEYFHWMCRKMADAAELALEDMSRASLGWGSGNAPNIAFVRRFRMKDGSVQTNPGINNPDIVEPIGEVDETVRLLRFDRIGKQRILLVHFGNHPDVVGGERISADWPGMLRREAERVFPGTVCLFVNGAQGDVNHVNVHPRGGDMNGLFPDFDGVARGEEHALHMARAVLGAVLQAYDKVKAVEDYTVRCASRVIRLPANKPGEEELAEARRIVACHREGKDEQIHAQGMMLTTVVAEAERMLAMAHSPEYIEMCLSAVSIGHIALIGLPGEPFTRIGQYLKRAEGWEMVLPACITNGYEGYFPTEDAYEEGGYEARSSRFRAGCGELIAKEGLTLLKRLRLGITEGEQNDRD